MNKKFYIQLDGLRAIAVLLVLVSHWIWIPFIQRLGLGFWGVNLFFVLSGFLITEILIKQVEAQSSGRQILKNFYIRRALRIFPIYYLVIIAAYALDLDNSREYSFYTFTYSINIYNAFHGTTGLYLSHLWSLCVEEQFYLVWPLLLLVFPSRYYLHVILITIIGAILYRYAFFYFNVPNYDIYNYRMTPSCMDALGLGALLAYLKVYKPERFLKVLSWVWIPWIALVLILILIFIPFGQSELYNQSFQRTLVSICSFYLIGLACLGFKGKWGNLLQNSWMQYFGKISYGIYLYHLIISHFLSVPLEEYLTYNLLPYLPNIFKYNLYTLTAPIYFIITIFTAAFSYLLIEKPILRFKEKFNYKWIPRLNSAS